MLDDATLVTALRTAWGWTAVSVTALGTGMTSRTWRVRHRGADTVAKWVPGPEAGHLRTGLEAATYAASAGLRTGTPRPCRDGRDRAGAARAAVEAVAGIPADDLTRGLCHGDPAPEAFCRTDPRSA